MEPRFSPEIEAALYAYENKRPTILGEKIRARVNAMRLRSLRVAVISLAVIVLRGSL